MWTDQQPNKVTEAMERPGKVKSIKNMTHRIRPDSEKQHMFNLYENQPDLWSDQSVLSDPEVISVTTTTFIGGKRPDSPLMTIQTKTVETAQ